MAIPLTVPFSNVTNRLLFNVHSLTPASQTPDKFADIVYRQLLSTNSTLYQFHSAGCGRGFGTANALSAQLYVTCWLTGRAGQSDFRWYKWF